MSMGALGYYLYQLEWSDNKTALMTGPTSHGHYQIELACESCHSEAFGGQEVLQTACVGCHEQELEIANDSHPKSKFTDPRNADRIEILDARYCVSCHTEHKPTQTAAMGVTVAGDYCYHCHVEIEEDRPSHAGMAFDSCASAGCHNYHDNRALYEDFLVEHANEGDLLAERWEPMLAKLLAGEQSLTAAQAQAPSQYSKADVVAEWQHSDHAVAGVNCQGCHSSKTSSEWVEKPSVEQCGQCHSVQTDSYLAGKHGMRIAANLSPMQNVVARLPMQEGSMDKEHTCNTCHAPHNNTERSAEVEVCLSCHADDHSLAYLDSPHGQDWQLENSGAVSCASCHLPKVADKSGKVFVQHNQNDNLRPNEKMIRPVCMNCHGLAFSIDALADEALILNNFSGKPAVHIPSIDMATSRSSDREQR